MLANCIIIMDYSLVSSCTAPRLSVPRVDKNNKLQYSYSAPLALVLLKVQAYLSDGRMPQQQTRWPCRLTWTGSQCFPPARGPKGNRKDLIIL